MDAVIEFIVTNPVVMFVIGTPIGLVLVFALYKAVIKIILSPKNIIMIAGIIDNSVDWLQKQDKSSGLETRTVLINLAERIIKDLKEDDGIS